MELSIVQQAYKDAEKIRTQFEQLLRPHQEMMRQFNAQARPAFEAAESINKTITQSLKPYQDAIKRFKEQLQPAYEAAERINRPVREMQRWTLRSYFSGLSRAIDFERMELSVPPPPAYKNPEFIADLVAAKVYERMSEQKPHSIETREEIATNLAVPRGTQWTDIKIIFLTYERIAITIGKRVFERNRKKLGFVLQKSKHTPKIWDLLFYFAAADGVLNWKSYTKNPLLQTLTQEEILKFKKRKSLLDKMLKNVFAISENPFLTYGKEQGYTTRFSITLADNFRKQLLPDERRMDENAEDDIGIHEEFRRLTNT